MRAIIGLYGRGQTGKTETLNLLIDLLEAPSAASPLPAPQPVGRDRRKVVRWQGITVGVCTAGDNEELVRENRDFFERNGCQVGITAARSWGHTHYVMHDHAKRCGARMIWVKKRLADSCCEQTNMLQARELLSLVAQQAAAATEPEAAPAV